MVIRTKFLSLAGGAVPAHPDGVELGHDLVDNFHIGSYKASLKIPPILVFGPHAGACQVGAAAIGKFTVNN